MPTSSGNISRYEQAMKWYLHVSNLRRLTVAFVFGATGASIGFIEGSLFSIRNGEELIPLAIFNLILSILGLLHEQRLYATHQDLAAYLTSLEVAHGPFTNSPLYKQSPFPQTNTTLNIALSLLILGWSVILYHHLDPAHNLAEKWLTQLGWSIQIP